MLKINTYYYKLTFCSMKAIFKNLITSFAMKAAVSVVAVFLMGGGSSICTACSQRKGD